ncbi:type II toxin-antitoxin system VapC family toxin [Pseudomonas sp. PDM04]|uniref:type II toxin-antitoxin system VapC family toxin n=1 Tax=Pseudomonas sp. PDM04 TaxID=2769296 RepID=UPI00177C1A89|nr:type II toxin-antitoxin system VapC family toxin [Pseudomonas sp. PDM04]MBD9440197.1 type II toxin-antitoxin system VapC family toxin [Pseudomonas sp. PDM04]
MRVLLDTHVLLWALADDPKLSGKARTLIDNAAEIYVSAATFWEMAIKVGLGKLSVDLEEIRQYCIESGFIELPVSAEHAIAVKDLEPHHRDPFDRIIVATAMSEPMKLMTADPIMARYTSLAILI